MEQSHLDVIVLLLFFILFLFLVVLFNTFCAIFAYLPIILAISVRLNLIFPAETNQATFVPISVLQIIVSVLRPRTRTVSAWGCPAGTFDHLCLGFALIIRAHFRRRIEVVVVLIWEVLV